MDCPTWLREHEQQKPWLLSMRLLLPSLAQPQVGLAARDPSAHDLTVLDAPVSTTA